MAIGAERINNDFGYHPATAVAASRHNHVREACKHLAFELDEALADGQEKSAAFTKLEEVMHWANASIAKEGPVVDLQQGPGGNH